MRFAIALTLLLAAGCEPGTTGGDQPSPAAPETSAAQAPAGRTPSNPAPPDMTPADLPPRLRALGTEPFWSADIVGDTVAWSAPDGPGSTFAITRRATPEGAVLVGRLDQANFVLAIARRDCSDGMSDRTYRWRAVLRRNGQSLPGCAETPDRLKAAPAP
ncbi:COG3650 family protein [Parablastomonas sp. CN1-191]|uniref:COG3650 family protein n=1 Tax=Parablastomonas sp. CN1-191 TaxID=3400908 RepID=UPI003BF7AF1C